MLTALLAAHAGPLAVSMPEDRFAEAAQSSRVPAELRAMPSSRWTLLSTLGVASCDVASSEIVAHLDRNDPSGYWTAYLVVHALLVERQGLPASDDEAARMSFGVHGERDRREGTPPSR